SPNGSATASSNAGAKHEESRQMSGQTKVVDHVLGDVKGRRHRRLRWALTSVVRFWLLARRRDRNFGARWFDPRGTGLLVAARARRRCRSEIFYRSYSRLLPARKVRIAGWVADQNVDGTVHGLVVFVCLCLAHSEVESDQRIGGPVHEPRRQTVMLRDGQRLPLRAG